MTPVWTLLLLAGAGAAAAAPPAAPPAATPPSASTPSSSVAPSSTATPSGGATGTGAAAQFTAELQPGLWEYRLTKSVGRPSEPQTTVTRHCSNPGDEIRQNLTNFERKGCRLSQMTHRGKRYESSWTCGSAGATVTLHSLLTVMNNHSYRDESEMHRGSQVVYSSVMAIRVGACPGSAPATPGAPAPGATAPGEPALPAAE